MKRPFSISGYHVVFGLSIVALISLGAWWTVFIRYSVELEKNAALDRLKNLAEVTAYKIGGSEYTPKTGPLKGTELEVVPATDWRLGDMSAPAVPGYREVIVRPSPAAIDRIEKKSERRHLMFVGEGSLLFFLIGVCVLMLYWLVRSDRLQMRMMEQFISTVTHEMKTPIAGLKSLLQTFHSGMLPKDQEQKLLAMGLKETERLDHMVENVLISGKLRTEWYKLDREQVNLKKFMENFIEHRKLFIAGGRATILLAWELSGDDVLVSCDRKAVSVILENLADNALKYGGDAPEVTVRIRRNGGYMEFRVEDRGIGFDNRTAEDLFKPFVRGSQTGVDVKHGTGLGLSISRQLARRMGGNLRAESEGSGRGSRFVLTLKESDK